MQQLILFFKENCPLNKLRENEFFKSHATNFALVLNLVVSNLQENFEQSCDALQVGDSGVNSIKTLGLGLAARSVTISRFSNNLLGHFHGLL